MLRRCISMLCCVAVLCIGLCSCGKEENTACIFENYNLPEVIGLCDSQTVAENDNFALYWDNDNQNVSFTDKRNGTVWSTTPAGFDVNNPDNNAYTLNGLRSMLNITYVDAKDNLEKEISSFEGAYSDGYIASRQIDDGLRLTFYFDTLKISIPVDFTLTDDGLTVRIRMSKIEEGENILYKISLLPFFTSAKNDTDSYLFVPSGNGALMNVDSGKRLVRSYTEEVYGDDAGQQKLTANIKTETVRMPVFGVKSENTGMIGIITEGAESAEINATAGDEQYGYSAVYASFKLRGCHSEMVESVGDTDAEVTNYSDVTSGVSGFSVSFIPLEDDVTYNGMAAAYRDYLDEKYDDIGSELFPVAAIDFLGGQKTKEFFLGVPHTTLKAATTFDDVQNILDDLLKTDAALTVRLTGFGDSGVNFGKIGEGLQPSSKFGGEKGYKALNLWCKENNIPLFLDTDMVFYNKSGNGYSVRNSAMSVNDTRSQYYYYDMVTNNLDTDSGYAFLNNRADLVRSVSNLKEMLEKTDTACVGLSTLSNTAYSDYDNGVYYVKSNMGIDVQYIYENLHKANYMIMSDSANDYAAVVSDFIFNAPSSSSQLNVFDKEIPFYHMVFRGMTGISGSSINLSTNPKRAFLEAMSLGSTLSFTLIDSFQDDFINGNYADFASAVYSDISESVKEYITQAKPLLEELGNARILSYEKNGEVSVTEFDNGTVVYVNFGDTEIQTPIGVIEPYSVRY